MTQLGQILFANVPSLPDSQSVKPPAIGEVAFADVNQKPIEAQSDHNFDSLPLPVTNLDANQINSDLEKPQLAPKQLTNSWDTGSSSEATKLTTESDPTFLAGASISSGYFESQTRLPVSDRLDTSFPSKQLPNSPAPNPIIIGRAKKRLTWTSITYPSSSDSRVLGTSANPLALAAGTRAKRAVVTEQLQPGVAASNQSEPLVTTAKESELSVAQSLNGTSHFDVNQVWVNSSIADTPGDSGPLVSQMKRVQLNALSLLEVSNNNPITTEAEPIRGSLFRLPETNVANLGQAQTGESAPSENGSYPVEITSVKPVTDPETPSPLDFTSRFKAEPKPLKANVDPINSATNITTPVEESVTRPPAGVTSAEPTSTLPVKSQLSPEQTDSKYQKTVFPDVVKSNNAFSPAENTETDFQNPKTILPDVVKSNNAFSPAGDTQLEFQYQKTVFPNVVKSNNAFSPAGDKQADFQYQKTVIPNVVKSNNAYSPAGDTQADYQYQKTVFPNVVKSNNAFLQTGESQADLSFDDQPKRPELFAEIETAQHDSMDFNVEFSDSHSQAEKIFSRSSEPHPGSAGPSVTQTDTSIGSVPSLGLPATEQLSSSVGVELKSPNVNSAISESVVNQVVEKIVTQTHSLTQNRDHRITLQINPVELGKLEIHIDSSADAMKAQIVASEFVTSELLVREQHQLLNSLRELGIDLPEVEISYQDPGTQPEQQDADARKQANHEAPSKLPTADNHAEPPATLNHRNNTSTTVDVVA